MNPRKFYSIHAIKLPTTAPRRVVRKYLNADTELHCILPVFCFAGYKAIQVNSMISNYINMLHCFLSQMKSLVILQEAHQKLVFVQMVEKAFGREPRSNFFLATAPSCW